MRLIAAFLCVFAAAPASAQGTYVGAALVADVARFSRVDTGDDSRSARETGSSADGEALGFAVTVGRAIATRWGVEFEFARSSEIEHEVARRITPLDLMRALGLPIPFPIPEIKVETEQQHTTFAAVAWARQALGARVDVHYVGGVSFNRVELGREIRISDNRLRLRLPVPTGTTTIDYHAGPVVGVDASLEFGEHAALVTGLRVHAVTIEDRGGWLIRPRAGVRWRF